MADAHFIPARWHITARLATSQGVCCSLPASARAFLRELSRKRRADVGLASRQLPKVPAMRSFTVLPWGEASWCTVDDTGSSGSTLLVRGNDTYRRGRDWC